MCSHHGLTGFPFELQNSTHFSSPIPFLSTQSWTHTCVKVGVVRLFRKGILDFKRWSPISPPLQREQTTRVHRRVVDHCSSPMKPPRDRQRSIWCGDEWSKLGTTVYRRNDRFLQTASFSAHSVRRALAGRNCRALSEWHSHGSRLSWKTIFQEEGERGREGSGDNMHRRVCVTQLWYSLIEVQLAQQPPLLDTVSVCVSGAQCFRRFGYLYCYITFLTFHSFSTVNSGMVFCQCVIWNWFFPDLPECGTVCALNCCNLELVILGACVLSRHIGVPSKAMEKLQRIVIFKEAWCLALYLW